MLPNQFYHVYTHANGSENLFRTEENYRYFLEKYAFHINAIADTFAYCLMPNHMHFLIRLKSEEDLKLLLSDKPTKVYENLGGLAIQAFSNLFNSYTKSYNLVYNRKGSLFIPNFKKSYHSLISEKATKLQREHVLKWFYSKAEFIKSHQKSTDFKLDMDF